MENATIDSAEDEDTEVLCLMRVGRKSGWLRLFEHAEVTLGRGIDVTYQLISPACPLMISRLHCVFKQREDGQWTVTDRKSMNGVWVNGNRLPASMAHVVLIGDSIQLGVTAPVTGNRVEFDYILVQRQLKDVNLFLVKPDREPERTKDAYRFKKLKRRISEESEPSTSSKPKLYRCSGTDKSSGQPCPLSPAEPPPQQQKQTTKKSETCLDGKEEETPSNMDYLQIYSQNILMLREQVDSTERQVASLEGQPQQSTPFREKQVQELQSQLETLRAKMDKMATLEKSFNEAKRQLSVHKENTLDVKELKTQQQEEHLKKHLDDALQEQKKVIDELALSHSTFKEMLLAKNKELEVTKEEKEKARAQKEEVVTQVTEVLENELQCIICSELFIEAVVLNCAHGFCRHCIQQWRKKKEECPICRQAIKSQTRCLALDNCIDSMVENLSLEMKSRRQTLISERKGLLSVEVIPDEDSSVTSYDAVLVGSSPASSVLSVDSDSDLDTVESSD